MIFKMEKEQTVLSFVIKKIKKIIGMILLSELSRRRIRSINKLVRVGRDECAVVVRVDKENGSLSFLEISGNRTIKFPSEIRQK